MRVQVTERRLATLQVGEAGLVFGRTDATDGERRYIGRVAISDEDNEPLVVDWRAPAAEPFYRATPGAPMGLVRRRHFILRGRRVTGLDDELLTAEPTGDDLVLVGEGALLAALERSRVGTHGRHRGHHPAGAGRDRPVAAARDRGRPGRPGHGQDGRRPPPGRLPALHVPVPAGAGRACS